MANKVSIFITNTDGKHFELTNSKQDILYAKQIHATNWTAVFPNSSINDYDIIISDFSKYGGGRACDYYIVQPCTQLDITKKIISDCKDLLSKQYDRMMMIRVAKKYNLNEMEKLKIEREFHSSENCEIDLKRYFA